MRYLEDLAVGERFLTKTVMVTEADILSFAQQFDPQPMHVDAERALDGPLRGLAASGWHTISMTMRLIVDADPLDGAPWLGLGVDEIRWPNPVRPGDSIGGEVEVVSITPSRSKPTHGVVRINTMVRNQKGELVLTMFPNLWVRRRPGSTSAA
jgi:acyl dehydratase